MKFIFPKNYNFKNKLFGLIDYNTIFLNVIWCTFIFCLINLIFNNLTLKIIIFILLCLPLIIFSVVGFNHENIINVLFYRSIKWRVMRDQTLFYLVQNYIYIIHCLNLNIFIVKHTKKCYNLFNYEVRL